MSKDAWTVRRIDNGGTDGDRSGARGGGTRPRARHHQMAVAINVTSILLYVLALGVIGLVQSRGGIADDYGGKVEGPLIVVEVSEGASLTDLSNQLVESGIVKSSRTFIRVANENSHSSELWPGLYRLHQRMRVDETAEAFPDVENRVGTVDIPIGAYFADTHIVSSSDVRKGTFSLISGATCVEDNGCVPKAGLERAIGETGLAVPGVPEWARDAVAARGNDLHRLEGLITPGIHRLDSQQTPEQILAKLAGESAKDYEDTETMASTDMVDPSPHELITAASLIQMKSPDGNFDRVARVTLNRLGELMQLQFGSTVNYNLQDQEIVTMDEDRTRKTAWNTYAKEGLPGAPAASPSIEMIRAMENPADGTWLYFVTMDREGSIVSSVTPEEHEAAIDESYSNDVLDPNYQEVELLCLQPIA